MHYLEKALSARRLFHAGKRQWAQYPRNISACKLSGIGKRIFTVERISEALLADLKLGKKVTRSLLHLILTTILLLVLACCWPMAFEHIALAQTFNVSLGGLQVIRYPCSVGRVAHQSSASFDLIVRNPSQSIINFNPELSKIEKFTDNNGGNLLPGLESLFLTAKQPMYSCLQKENEHEVLITVTTNAILNDKATEVYIKGKLAFEVGTANKSIRSAELTLKKGSKVKVGDVVFEVAESSEHDKDLFPGFFLNDQPKTNSADISPPRLALVIQGDSSRIQSLRAFKSGDKEIKVNTSSTTRISAGKSTSQTLYIFDDTIDKVTLLIDYWTEVRTDTVPFELVANLSLSPDQRKTQLDRSALRDEAEAIAIAKDYAVAKGFSLEHEKITAKFDRDQKRWEVSFETVTEPQIPVGVFIVIIDDRSGKVLDLLHGD